MNRTAAETLFAGWRWPVVLALYGALLAWAVHFTVRRNLGHRGHREELAGS